MLDHSHVTCGSTNWSYLSSVLLPSTRSLGETLPAWGRNPKGSPSSRASSVSVDAEVASKVESPVWYTVTWFYSYSARADWCLLLYIQIPYHIGGYREWRWVAAFISLSLSLYIYIYIYIYYTYVCNTPDISCYRWFGFGARGGSQCVAKGCTRVCSPLSHVRLYMVSLFYVSTCVRRHLRYLRVHMLVTAPPLRARALAALAALAELAALAAPCSLVTQG